VWIFENIFAVGTFGIFFFFFEISHLCLIWLFCRLWVASCYRSWWLIVSAHGEISQVKIPAEDRTTDISAQNNFWTFWFFEYFGANSSIQLMNDNFGIRISTGKVVGFSFLVLMMSTGPSSFSCCCCRDIYYISRPPGEEDSERERDLNAPKRFYILIPLFLLPRKVYSNHGRRRRNVSSRKTKKVKHLLDSYRFFFLFFFVFLAVTLGRPWRDGGRQAVERFFQNSRCISLRVGMGLTLVVS
jgi:hypothetical protein